MQAKPQNRPDPEKSLAERRAEARRHRIFGVIAMVVIAGLIGLLFVIEEMGDSRMPNGQLQQPHDAAEK
ncbi:MAG TPA: hypothetical protein VF816_08330 [Rhodocyclaceae bacterium]